MTTGLTAALTVTSRGTGASSQGQEVDLDIDPDGDLLTIDPAGGVLIVTVGALTFTGTTASIAVSDPSVTLESEGWQGFQTETGQAIETEGT